MSGEHEIWQSAVVVVLSCADVIVSRVMLLRPPLKMTIRLSDGRHVLKFGEASGGERLGEDVGMKTWSVELKWRTKIGGDVFSNEVIVNLNMFGSYIKDWVIGKKNCRYIVGRKDCRLVN